MVWKSMLLNDKLFKTEVDLAINISKKTPKDIFKDVWSWILGKKLVEVFTRVVD